LGALARRIAMNDQEAIAALVSDLHWQIDQLGPRDIKNNAGGPYNPSYYKRGLRNAIDQGDLAVAEYVRRSLYKAPSDGYRKLEDADSLDLACEALVADETKPYAHLFTEADRAAARKRLARHIEAIEQRKAATSARIDARRSELPDDIAQLREHAAQTTQPEDAIAVNMAILRHAPDDSVAMNRLGRAYEAIGSIAQAKQTFQRAVEVNPDNTIAVGRLRDLVRSQRR
jgi:tetratricopeptide (TPR) repeat protein